MFKSIGVEPRVCGRELSVARLEADVDKFLRKGMLENRPDRDEDGGVVAGDEYDEDDAEDEDEDEEVRTGVCSVKLGPESFMSPKYLSVSFRATS